jgi:hypothetical protein
LAREFESFVVWQRDDAIEIKPRMLWNGTVWEGTFGGLEPPPWLIFGDDDPPPMQWIKTTVENPALIAGPNADNAQEYRPFPQGSNCRP